MADNKTRPTGEAVDAFLDAAPANRRDDARRIAELMGKVSGEPAAMWGPSIVGFGTHHYRYASGREGDICAIGFSPRKAANVLYLACDLDAHQPLLDRLGKHQRGGGCLYVKRLADIDEAVLQELLLSAWQNRAPEAG